MADGLSPTWTAYKALTDDLMTLRGQLAELQMHERTQRITAYANSAEGSVSARERESDVVTLELSTEIINTKAAIAAKEDLRQMLELAIQQGVEVL